MNVTNQTLTDRSGSPSRRVTAPRAWSGPLALALAGILFALSPMIRPFSDETSLDGAAAFASAAWLVAHALAMTAFVLLILGFLFLHLRLKDTPLGRRSLRALVLGWLGVGLTLPFYGAETFGVAAVGQAALDLGDASLVTVAEAIRLGPGIGFIVLGLVLLAAGAVLFATTMWHAGDHPKWIGVPLAVGLVLYLPQFPTPQPVRVAHGVVMAAGCLLLARHLVTSARAGVASTAATPNGEHAAEPTRS